MRIPVRIRLHAVIYNDLHVRVWSVWKSELWLFCGHNVATTGASMAGCCYYWCCLWDSSSLSSKWYVTVDPKYYSPMYPCQSIDCLLTPAIGVNIQNRPMRPEGLAVCKNKQTNKQKMHRHRLCVMTWTSVSATMYGVFGSLLTVCSTVLNENRASALYSIQGLIQGGELYINFTYMYLNLLSTAKNEHVLINIK